MGSAERVTLFHDNLHKNVSRHKREREREREREKNW
jgi:hypothetical protein